MAPHAFASPIAHGGTLTGCSFPRLCTKLRAALLHSASDQLQLDVLELDRKFLVLKADAAIGELRVVNVQRRCSVKNDDQVVALGRNLVVIPSVRKELVLL